MNVLLPLSSLEKTHSGCQTLKGTQIHTIDNSFFFLFSLFYCTVPDGCFFFTVVWEGCGLVWALTVSPLGARFLNTSEVFHPSVPRETFVSVRH